jgi:hypothetical protein
VRDRDADLNCVGVAARTHSTMREKARARAKGGPEDLNCAFVSSRVHMHACVYAHHTTQRECIRTQTLEYTQQRVCTRTQTHTGAHNTTTHTQAHTTPQHTHRRTQHHNTHTGAHNTTTQHHNTTPQHKPQIVTAHSTLQIPKVTDEMANMRPMMKRTGPCANAARRPTRSPV